MFSSPRVGAGPLPGHPAHTLDFLSGKLKLQDFNFLPRLVSTSLQSDLPLPIRLLTIHKPPALRPNDFDKDILPESPRFRYIFNGEIFPALDSISQIHLGRLLLPILS